MLTNELSRFLSRQVIGSDTHTSTYDTDQSQPVLERLVGLLGLAEALAFHSYLIPLAGQITLLSIRTVVPMRSTGESMISHLAVRRDALLERCNYLSCLIHPPSLKVVSLALCSPVHHQLFVEKNLWLATFSKTRKLRLGWSEPYLDVGRVLSRHLAPDHVAEVNRRRLASSVVQRLAP